MPNFAQVGDDDFIVCQVNQPEQPEDEPGGAWHPLAEKLGLRRPSESMRWKWNGGQPALIETATLDEIKARAIAEIDRDADASRLTVVGDAARIKEYERAEQQAAAFRDAGFVGEVPPCVACWARAKAWTPQQAAEDILAAAARWISALENIRALRLQAKEDVRRAVGGPEVEAIHANFSATLTTMMQGV